MKHKLARVKHDNCLMGSKEVSETMAQQAVNKVMKKLLATNSRRQHLITINQEWQNLRQEVTNNPGTPGKLVKLMTVERHFFENINASLPRPMNLEEHKLVRNSGTRQFLRKHKVEVHSDIPTSVLPSSFSST